MKRGFRHHRGRRRPCRHRGGGRGGAHGRVGRAGQLRPRPDRRDVVQPGDRRARQGPSGPRGRRLRRADRARLRSRPRSTIACSTRSKGAAVRGPRVQADRKRYKAAIHALIEAQAGLEVVEGEAAALRLEGRRVDRARRWRTGARSRRSAVILATGTFLGGKLHFGMASRAGGRVGERAATALAHQLRALGLPLARLKTGTPPRLDGRTIDWAALERQESDGEQLDDVAAERGPARCRSSSARSPAPMRARTSIIRANLDRSPLFAGEISGRRARVTARRSRTRSTASATATATRSSSSPRGWTIRPSIPTASPPRCPRMCSWRWSRSMAGLERAEILQPGYAVEYDHVDPRILEPTLGVRDVDGPLSRRADQRHHRL